MITVGFVGMSLRRSRTSGLPHTTVTSGRVAGRQPDACTHVAGQCLALLPAELGVQRRGRVDGDLVMRHSRAGHRENLAVVIFALALGRTVEFEVLLFRKDCLWERGHGSSWEKSTISWP